MGFFILLASTAGIVGTRGQSNYASGNTFQDALAHYRLSLGQKSISLDLGLVLSVGFAAENRETMDSMKRRGYRGIREVELHAILGYLCDPSLQPRESQIVVGVENPDMSKAKDSRDGIDWFRWARRPLFRHLMQMDRQETTATQGSEVDVNYEALFKAAGSPSMAARHVAQALKKKLSKTLWVPEEDIDTQKPIHSFGVDSLVAVEIRYWLTKEMKADVSIFQIMASDSLEALSLLTAEKSSFFT